MASYQSKKVIQARTLFDERRNNPPSPAVREFMNGKLQETLYGLLKPAIAKKESKVILEFRMTQTTSEELQWLAIELADMVSKVQSTVGIKLELGEVSASIQDLNINAGNGIVRKSDPIICAWSWRIPSSKMAYGDTVSASSIIRVMNGF